MNSHKFVIGVLVCLFLALALWWGTSQKTEAPIQETKQDILTNSAESNTLSPTTSRVSFRYLLERSYAAPGLTVGELLATTETYKKYKATYQSDNLTISGILYLPTTIKPDTGYPVLVTNHGYIDVGVYTTGRGLKREQEYFANRGYIVFHPDYRNHAQSSKTSNNPIEDRLGYIVDIIHAVESLRNSSLPIDRNNITLLGHSMGGGATLAGAVIQKNIANRIALYAPVTLNYLDSYNRYQKDDPKRAERIRATYGTPEENKGFWEGLNGEPYVDRIAIPIQIYHGTNDADVPYDWSLHTLEILREKNKTAELITYEGEGHEFSFAWHQFMDSVERFTKK